MAKKAEGTTTRSRQKPKPPHKLVPGDSVRLKDREVNGQSIVGVVTGIPETPRKQVLQGTAVVAFAQVIPLREGQTVVQRPQLVLVPIPVDQLEWLEEPEASNRGEFNEFADADAMIAHYSKP